MKTVKFLFRNARSSAAVPLIWLMQTIVNLLDYTQMLTGWVSEQFCTKNKMGWIREIAYASRTLSNFEKNYPAHRLEFLALKWAETEKFHEYLSGVKFKVHTDNNPLACNLTSARLDAVGQQWIASLANYDFQLYYKTGKSNDEADAL